MRLVKSLATRGRPARLIETVEISVANWRNPDTVMYIMADEDDKPTIDAVVSKWGNKHPQIRLAVAPREDTIAEKWNRILKIAPNEELYMSAADDDPYITPGYDQLVINAAQKFPDGIGIVYGHMANASFTRAAAPTGKYVKKLGYMFPEYFPYWFVDHWVDDVSKLIGRISFADITTDQNRPGKTQELREVAWWATWFDAAYLMRRKQAHDIINGVDFEEPQWRKEILLANHPMLEFHTRWINNSVRSMSLQLDQWSGLNNQDDRYLRVKNRAMAMVPHLLNDYGMPNEERAYFAKELLPQHIPSFKRAFAA